MNTCNSCKHYDLGCNKLTVNLFLTDKTDDKAAQASLDAYRALKDKLKVVIDQPDKFNCSSHTI